MVASAVTRLTELSQRLDAVRADIDRFVAAAGREPGSVTLLPVTKFHPASDIAILQSLGVTAVAENREQEARDKAEALPDVAFHMIGQVQTKKANSVARWAAAVHSVDTPKLVDALSRGMALALERGDRTSDTLPCFVQLSLDGDLSRGGIAVPDALPLAEKIASAPHLTLAGLMCVPPLSWDATDAFSTAAKVRSDLEEHFGHSLDFSAGMSGDMAAAISCGSTIVRVGTAIMGPRPLR